MVEGSEGRWWKEEKENVNKGRRMLITRKRRRMLIKGGEGINKEEKENVDK